MNRFLICLKVWAAPLVATLSLFITFACRAGLSRLVARSLTNDISLGGAPIRTMSAATTAALQQFDAAAAIQKRRENFAFIHERLQSSFPFALADDDVPMVYPYVSDDGALRSRLIEQKIYVAKYWPQLSQRVEGMADRIIPMTVDQRYAVDDMRKVILSMGGKA